MPNIFEATDQQIGGAFTAENCVLDLGVGIDKAIVQRVQFTIERPINFVYEIGNQLGQPQNIYYVGGRRRGEATFERIVGGSQTFKKFIDNYGPLCQPTGGTATAFGSPIVLTAHGNCNVSGAPAGIAALPVGISYTLKTPKITRLGGSVSAQDIVIMETVSLVFLDLEYGEV